jgi:hypothetical protein
VGAKLYVRAAYGAFHKPDEIVKEIFKLDQLFNPIFVAVEEDGLNEFILTPLRQHTLTTGQVVPIRPVRAPQEKSKNSFIRGLQPFFEAKEVLLCGDFPDLKSELLSFPTGRKDVLNALAYALRLRAGKPIYPDFGLLHITPELKVMMQQPAYLCVNVRPSHTTAVLIQYINGALRVFADWVKEGTPGQGLEKIIPEATLAAGKRVKLFVPKEQFNQYNNFGLPAACRKLNLEVMKGPDEAIGSLSTFLRQQNMGMPSFLIARDARWTVNGLATGYAWSLDKTGILNADPDEGYYCTLLEGVESFAKWLTTQVEVADGGQLNYAYTAGGRRFLSSRPGPDHGGTQQFKR